MGRSGGPVSIDPDYEQRRVSGDWQTAPLRREFTWTQDPAGNPYLGTVLTTADPNTAYARQKKTEQAVDGNTLDAQAAALGISSVSSSQFMDFIILHELAHAIRKVDPDSLSVEKNIWNNCFKW